jgi:ubiquinone/menaquinone biosynthesis C-methylase UbiE/heme-degrading monooxygenase HmoA
MLSLNDCQLDPSLWQDMASCKLRTTHWIDCMILETAFLSVKPGQEAEFEVAIKMAKPLIAASNGFQGMEVRANLDVAGQYLLLVWWDSVEDHEIGFRQSELYGRWKELLHHFYDPFPKVEHFGENVTQGNTAIYEQIGVSYNQTRVPDPRIADRLIELMAPRDDARILDIACGTANYTGLLAGRGLDMTGLDLSATMLKNARANNPGLDLVRGSVDAMPLPDGGFDNVMCTLAIHHFPDIGTAFAEVARVLRGDRFVVFSATPEQTAGYWLAHYFPDAIRRAVEQMPATEVIERALKEAGFNHIEIENWEVPENLTDQFAYAGKNNPALYFEEGVLEGISVFANLGHPDELEAGLKALRQDLDSGEWQNIRAQYDHDLGDYCFFIARK